MKFAAAILAFIILITSVYPVSKHSFQINSIQKDQPRQCCIQKTLCSKTENNHEKNNSKKDCNSGCSPFLTCNYFPVTEPSGYPAITPKYIIATSRFPIFEAHFSSDYFAEFWHPPQFS